MGVNGAGGTGQKVPLGGRGDRGAAALCLDGSSWFSLLRVAAPRRDLLERGEHPQGSSPHPTLGKTRSGHWRQKSEKSLEILENLRTS